MDNSELQVSYWLVTARPFVKKLALGLFLLFDALLAVNIFVQTVSFILSSRANERIIASVAHNSVITAALNSRLVPSPITVSQTAVLSGKTGSYTLVAIAKNPSLRWAVETVDYTFLLNQQELAHGTTSFFPGEERYLMQFNVPLARVTSQNSMTVEFSNPHWRRVLAATDLPPVDLKVTETAYHLLSTEPTNQLSQVTATVTNGSVITLPNVSVNTILLNGGTIIGAGQLLLADVKPLEVRQVDIRFYQALSVGNVLLGANVDLAAFPQ